MNTIYWRMNATQGGSNLHPGVNLLPGANLHPGAYCAHEHGFRLNDGPDLKLFILVGWDRSFRLLLGPLGHN